MSVEMESAPQVEIYLAQNLTHKILEAVFAVHSTLGCGFLGKVYSNSLTCELRNMNLVCEQEVVFKANYREFVAGDYCADLFVKKRIIVELKDCATLESVHEAQLLNYL